MEVQGLAAHDSSGVLSPFKFSRRWSPNSKDVVIQILFCGICHSDLSQIKNSWGMSMYPVVPGHEIVGVVTQVGSVATKFKPGEHVGVGCMAGSCKSCNSCEQGLENYCSQLVWTYNSPLADGSHTFGGYSSSIVVDESFVVRIPESLPLEAAAPLLCAGITVYSPMKHYGMAEAGKSLGVVGLGGLGHMAVKFGKAFGMKVTVISSSASKKVQAKDVLGADEFLVSSEPGQMMAAAASLDFVIDTVSAVHSLEPLLSLLTTGGTLVLLGVPEGPLQVSPHALVSARKSIGGSLIGSIRETQEMLHFCGQHKVTPVVEKIPKDPDSVNTAMETLSKSEVHYRFVIDMA